jgi:GT2 family glycosyltransferase
MFSIVIPVFNQREYTEACINSIRECSLGEDYEIVIVDNGSTEDIEIDGSDIALVSNESNLGFPIAVNQGIREAKGSIIIILNNDVIVTPDWLSHFNRHLSNGYDIVGPCTNMISGPQQTLLKIYRDKDELYDISSEFSKINYGKVIPFHRIVFFCTAIKKEVVDKIGLLDEIFSPGNFEDDDYCLRAIEVGFKLCIARDMFVHHFGNVTHRSMDFNYAGLLMDNNKKFSDKWSNDKVKGLSERNNVIREGNDNG